MIGFGYTTAKTETSVRVNQLRLLAEDEVHWVWMSTNQNNQLTVIAGSEESRLQLQNWDLVQWRQDCCNSKWWATGPDYIFLGHITH